MSPMPPHASVEGAVLPNVDIIGPHLADAGMPISLVELCHRRLVVFALATTMALSVEVCYAKMVPKLPQLYAVLLRAAVWDCVLVGVLVAQLTDLSSYMPVVAGTDGSHFFPLAVLLYHVLTFIVCIGNDLLDRMRGNSPSRDLHRSLVLKRVLFELAGGTKGSRLALGRACFLVSVAAMWFLLRALLWIGNRNWEFSFLIVTMFVAYGAAGFAALDLRKTLPGHLVQWLCTGWGFQDTILKGPIKLLGVFLLFPFALSVIVAQIWLRAVVFLVWIVVACPCCRLKRNDDVYDAFGREVLLPLLQCSFLAFASTIAVLVLARVNGHLDGTHYIVACMSALYYVGMLLAWTAPMVLRIKVGFEETSEIVLPNIEDGEDASQVELLRANMLEGEGMELEELKSSYEEVRALLNRERHDHTVEIMQLQDRLKDAELRTRLTQRNLQAVDKARKESDDKVSLLEKEVSEWQRRYAEVAKKACPVVSSEPMSPEVQTPSCAIPTQPEPEPRSSEPKTSLADLLPLASAEDQTSHIDCEKQESDANVNISDYPKIENPIDKIDNAVLPGDQDCIVKQIHESNEDELAGRRSDPETGKGYCNDIANPSLVNIQTVMVENTSKESDQKCNEEIASETKAEGTSESSIAESPLGTPTARSEGKESTDDDDFRSVDMGTANQNDLDENIDSMIEGNTIEDACAIDSNVSPTEVWRTSPAKIFQPEFESETDKEDKA